MQKLSKKGVLFLTSGFNQHYVFQNIAHLIEEGNDQTMKKSLKIILSDGEIYISGVFMIESSDNLDKCKRIKEFDLLRVFASYEGVAKPILITSLEIFSQGHHGIYGFPPISLKDYMESRLAKSCNDGKLLTQSYDRVEKKKTQQIANLILKSNSLRLEKQHLQIQEKAQIIQDNLEPEKKQKENLSFQLSNEQNQYDLLKDINDIQTKKRDFLIQSNQQLVINSQKKHKLNEEEHQQGQMVLKQNQKIIQNKRQEHNPQKIELENHLISMKNQSLRSQNQQITKTQNITIKKPKLIEIIDLDDELTFKQSAPIYGQSNRRQYRKSHLEFIQEILKSDEKQTQKQSFYNAPQQNNDSVTIPRSQTLVQKNLITPPKTFDHNLILNSSNQQITGSTIQRKKLRQEYNLLIENLYESNSSFKIICRVNNLYEWRSKNGVPCLALDLMDSMGDQIKAIVYMNHSSKQCKQCGEMVEVGKVYCFQNGECKRDFVEKQALQLLFNLRTKNSWSKEIPCGGRNKIIPASKIKIQPIFQNRILSISQLAEQVQSGKNSLTHIYGILESFKFNQFEKKGNVNEKEANQVQEQKSDPEFQLIQLQNVSRQKKTAKKSNVKTINKQGPTNIYLNGFLADPIQRKKIAFACIISKPSNGTQVITAQDFLTKNGIKKGALIILHNIRVQSTNNNKVHKLQKTKRTYMQIISDRYMKWSYVGTQFASETVIINDIDDNTPLYPALKQILSFTQKQIDSIMQNPRVVNYSKQPFTERSIFALNQLLQKSMMPQQNCFSQIKGVKMHSIEQKPSVDICFYCKKKAKSPQNKSNTTSQMIKHCQRCKMIVKTITMHIFNIVFADDTASFLVEVLKNEYLETILGLKIQDFLALSGNQRKHHLEAINYTEFVITLRSQKKIGGDIHKINSIEKMPIKARIQEIKQQKKGPPKHYTRLDSSW